MEPPYRYYDDLSAGGTSSDSSDDEDDDESACGESSRTHNLAKNDQRFIVFVDVDCFYCQCECIDRGIPEERPFAIGQKHIIVTCNYAARKYGVSKLQLREDAYRHCPHLLIVEGSDLERYRIYARKIYESFRQACKTIQTDIAVCKGSMDEMMADLSSCCHSAPAMMKAKARLDPSVLDFTPYTYGEADEKTVLKEDQSGVFAMVTYTKNLNLSTGEVSEVQDSLRFVAICAMHIRQTILRETGFKTTLGVSVNPLLSKVAVG